MTVRRKPSVGLGLKVALLQLGIQPKTARLDHIPALGLRAKTEHEDGSVTYVPDEHDPFFMQWLPGGTDAREPGTHDRKTFGSKATSAGSDIANIAKAKRIAADQEAFRQRMLAKEPGKPREKTGRIRSRGFQRKPQQTIERGPR